MRNRDLNSLRLIRIDNGQYLRWLRIELGAYRILLGMMILIGVVFIPWQLTSLARHIMLETNRRRATCKSCGLLYHDRDASHCKACGTLIYQEYDGI